MIVYSSKNSKKEIVITSMPGRESYLGIREGSTITKVASFNGEDERDLFVDTLVEFLRIGAIRSEV